MPEGPGVFWALFPTDLNSTGRHTFRTRLKHDCSGDGLSISFFFVRLFNLKQEVEHTEPHALMQVSPVL